MSNALDPTLPPADRKLPPDRNFGLLFAAVFILIGARPLLGGAPPRWWAIALAGLFAIAAIVYPRALRPLTRAWMAFGDVLHRAISPLIMGAVFFLVVTPIGVTMRLLGKDVLSLRRRPDLSSYWIKRDPPGPTPESLTNQF